MLWLMTGIVLAVCQAAEAQPLLIPLTDYGRSFVTTAGGAGNQPVFWIESRCRISDPAAGVVRDCYQCASCKSEDTFAARDLFSGNNKVVIIAASEYLEMYGIPLLIHHTHCD